GAVQGWHQLMRQLQPRLSDNRVKEEYFDCYYHRAYCIFKDALKINDTKKKVNQMRIAADYIVKLEAEANADNTAKARFTELLAQEPLLREQYDDLKKHHK